MVSGLGGASRGAALAVLSCAALVALGLGGCASRPAVPVAAGSVSGASTGSAASAAPRPLPAIDPQQAAQAYAGARSYGGTLSCAGCPDRTLTLTVFADGTFRLREIEAALAAASGVPARTSFDVGRWSTTPAGPDRLLLHGASGGSWLLHRVVPDGLSLLDNEGREIRGLSGSTLARLPQIDPLPGPMRLAGLYGQRAGQAVFEECATGRRLTVRAAGADPALEAAFRAMQRSPDETVMAVVDGYFLPRVDGPVHEALHIASFIQAMRAARCDEIVGSKP
ncbi:MAG: copper resistance protein NlpE N-terminal domain-containing protein [Burkholderiaceae bacterium]